jgi:transposase-like protein
VIGTEPSDPTLTLVRQTVIRALEAALEDELTAHLGYGRHQRRPPGTDNARNGKRYKTVLTALGPLRLAVPRDRRGTFRPRTIQRWQRRLAEFDATVISLAAKGLTTGQVTRHLAQVRDIRISRQTVSTITSQLRHTMESWRNRPLPRSYPVIFLDALHVKIREQRVASRPVYLAWGIDHSGGAEVIGLWAGSSKEGAGSWRRNLLWLRRRGLTEALIVVCDGLPGLPEAVGGVWPRARVQRCVVHLLRSTFRLVRRHHWPEFHRMLARFCAARDRAEALVILMVLEARWGRAYPEAVRHWQQLWASDPPFLGQTSQIRRAMYSTNVVESLNSRIRRALRPRGHFPSAQSALKHVYLLLTDLGLTSATPPRAHWAAAARAARRHHEPAPAPSAGSLQVATLPLQRPPEPGPVRHWMVPAAAG